MDLDAVARGAADDAGGLDPALLGDFLPTVVGAAQSGRTLRRAQLDRYGERGAEAARAGVPLRALVDLYLSASWRLWGELDVVQQGSAEQVRAAGLAVLRAADDGVAALAEGFQLARADLVRREEVERRDVLDELLAGGAAATAALPRAADIGLDLTSPHAVLLAAPSAPGAGSAQAAGAVVGRLERALAGRLGDAQPLVAVREGRLVCLFAAPDERAVEQVSDRVAQLLAGPAGQRWQLAVGRALAGAGGVRVSFDSAADALELAVRLGLEQPVVRPADLAVYRVLLRDRAAITELIETTLGPLQGVRGGAELLETLVTYYATGAVATETARRLHLSVRAVTYRLARVQRLLGRDPADPEHRLALHAASLGARLLGWPQAPLGD
ncbi:sugar diacid utilization regulator [Motilibacter peucedani]|uniref:Sugar diacid utilization regulator n=1 Tax=Motilibacter peucedani TaxID=598650 RepID=A0A420XU16_9ACTN|nr:helix-turn-helix domain-containing protein [Motilibacter peucedani]RKS80149.1 sugar diacid utilization regulator [Motilibacter peucedani]